jgi:hypothetical protein
MARSRKKALRQRCRSNCRRCLNPRVAKIDQTYGIIVTGIGGTGVVTVGAIVGMAAHLEGKACGIVDMAGLAQKGGAVLSPYPRGGKARGYSRHPRAGARRRSRARRRPRRRGRQEGARGHEARAPRSSS